MNARHSTCNILKRTTEETKIKLRTFFYFHITIFVCDIWWRVLHFIIILISCVCAFRVYIWLNCGAAYISGVWTKWTSMCVLHKTIHLNTWMQYCAWVFYSFHSSRKFSKNVLSLSVVSLELYLALDSFTGCSSSFRFVAKPFNLLQQGIVIVINHVLPCEIINYYYYACTHTHSLTTHLCVHCVHVAEFHELLLNRKLSLIYFIRTTAYLFQCISAFSKCHSNYNVVAVVRTHSAHTMLHYMYPHSLRWTNTYFNGRNGSNVANIQNALAPLMSFIGVHLFTYILVNFIMCSCSESIICSPCSQSSHPIEHGKYVLCRCSVQQPQPKQSKIQIESSNKTLLTLLTAAACEFHLNANECEFFFFNCFIRDNEIVRVDWRAIRTFVYPLLALLVTMTSATCRQL